MTYKEEQLLVVYFWRIVTIIVLFVCSWITLAIWHAVHEPPQTASDKAQNAFIQSCENSEYGDRQGVPDVTVHPWTCTIPLGKEN